MGVTPSPDYRTPYACGMYAESLVLSALNAPFLNFVRIGRNVAIAIVMHALLEALGSRLFAEDPAVKGTNRSGTTVLSLPTSAFLGMLVIAGNVSRPQIAAISALTEAFRTSTETTPQLMNAIHSYDQKAVRVTEEFIEKNEALRSMIGAYGEHLQHLTERYNVRSLKVLNTMWFVQDKKSS